jgi:hypothetical protein|tara:strand:+ start:7239 stop:7427 length:189 start_codon:yes stop_codon:yes gene_type:complete
MKKRKKESKLKTTGKFIKFHIPILLGPPGAIYVMAKYERNLKKKGFVIGGKGRKPKKRELWD